MGRRHPALIVAFALVMPLWLGGVGHARADDDADTQASAERLEGVVLDVGGGPASGAAVILTGRGVRREAPADAGGRFFLDVEPGVYLVSASAGSVASQEVRVEIRDGETPPLLTLLLQPPLPVEQATVTASRTGDRNTLKLDSLHTLDVFASMPIAGRLEVFLAGENLLNDRFETGRTPVVTLGAPRTVTAGVRLARCPLGARCCHAEIDALLDDYGVPRLPLPDPVPAAAH